MRNHAQKEDDSEINMTPMLDIVFIMLIFFIVTAVFVKEAGIEVEKPDSTMALTQKQVSILIAITDNDTVHINREEVALANVRTAVEKLHAENPRGTVALQADKKSKASLMLKVYDAVREAGVTTIAIAAETK